jgi:hypothetical protein
MAELDASTESPPSCPSDNGDRLDREPLRLDEKAEGGTSPSNPPRKRKMSEKQLEILRKAREAKAAKARGVKAPPQPTEDVQPVEEVSPPITKQETPKRVKISATKPKSKPTLIEVRTYHEEPTYKTEMFNVLSPRKVRCCNKFISIVGMLIFYIKQDPKRFG